MQSAASYAALKTHFVREVTIGLGLSAVGAFFWYVRGSDTPRCCCSAPRNLVPLAFAVVSAAPLHCARHALVAQEHVPQERHPPCV